MTRVGADRPISLPKFFCARQPESTGAVAPFWSPDSRYIGFSSEGRLKRVAAVGGKPETIGNLPVAAGATWNKDGVILCAFRADGTLSRTTSGGGTPVQVTKLGPDEFAHRWPYFLPDGKHFLYSVVGKGGASVWVASLDSDDKRKVADGSRAVYGSGFLLFVRDGALFGQPFDLSRLETTGDPLRITERIDVNPNNLNASYSVSDTNRLVFRPPDQNRTGPLIWFDRTGRMVGAVSGSATPGSPIVPSLSRDEKKVVVSVDNTDLWLADLERGTFSRFTFDGKTNVVPLWSPDGQRVLFRSSRSGTGDLFIKDASGASPEAPLLLSPGAKSPTDWSPDGQYVMYEAAGEESPLADLWFIPVTGDRKPQPYLRGPFNEQQGRFSPDGRWVAYTSDESGSPQIYIQSFPKPAAKWQVSTGGGADPRWRSDGKELFFVSVDQKMMSVTIDTTADKVQPGIPKELFSVRVTGLTDTRTHYAVASDGKRFLISTRNDASMVSPITVVLNWPAAVKK